MRVVVQDRRSVPRLVLALSIVMALGGSALADSFEFLAYTPPPATWTKQTSEGGGVTYVTTGSGAGMIMLVPSVTPIGTPIEEFETYWRANVEPIIKAPLPEPKSRPARDLTMVWGSSRATQRGHTFDVQVVMFVGRGSVLGTVTLTSSAQSVRDVAAFNASVKVLDENRPIAKPSDPPPAKLAFEYVAPAGFGKTKTENGITAHSYDGGVVRDACMFAMYPALASSGDLEKDVDSAIQTVPAGWTPPGRAFATQQKGIGPTGWPYVYKTARVSSNGRTATVLVVGIPAPNKQTSFVYGFGGADCPLENSLEQLFHTIVPKGWSSDQGKAFKAALEKKSWGEYVFGSTGRYRNKRALGTWKLAGSTILLSPDAGTNETLRVRVVSDYTSARWRDAIVVLTDASVRVLAEAR